VRVASRGDNKEESVPIELARRSPRPPPPPPDRPRASEPARIPSTPPVRTTDTEAEPAHVGERDTWRPGPRSEPSTLAWVFLLVVLGVLGFVGYELVGGSVREDDETETPANAEETEGEADPEGAGEEIDPERTGTEDLGEIPPQELSYGETIPRIEPGPVSVAEGEGLLVVELPASGVPTEVQIGERELGNTPVRLALPEGRHELVFRRGDETSYRYLYLRAGQTRVVQAP
jgi:hypothetical protein